MDVQTSANMNKLILGFYEIMKTSAELVSNGIGTEESFPPRSGSVFFIFLVSLTIPGVTLGP